MSISETSTPEALKAAGIGDNSADEVTFLKHVRTCIAADLKVSEARSARQSVRKLAKADGIELKQLDAVVAMADWAPSEIRDNFATRQQYAIWLGLPIGTQLDLLDGVPAAALPDIDWESAGYTAALTGIGCHAEAPDNCPADQVQNFLKGVHRAFDKIGGEMAPAGNA